MHGQIGENSNRLVLDSCPAIIVPAAGSGVRLGHSVPKAFVSIGGRSLLQHALVRIRDSELFRLVVVVCPPDDLALAERHSREVVGDELDLAIISGGETRQDSVHNAVQLLSQRRALPGDTLVAIHDAARCFAPIEVFGRALVAAQHALAVTAAIPAVDSLAMVSADRLAEYLPRESVVHIQTPQVFTLDLLARAHALGVQATDDAALVRRLHAVQVIEGDPRSFKITSPQDLRRAEALISS